MSKLQGGGDHLPLPTLRTIVYVAKVAQVDEGKAAKIFFSRVGNRFCIAKYVLFSEFKI